MRIIRRLCWGSSKGISNDVLFASHPFDVEWVIKYLLSKSDDPLVVDLIQVFGKDSNKRSVVCHNIEALNPLKKKVAFLNCPDDRC